MNQQERSEVVKIYIHLSELYGRQLSRDALGLLADSLMDLDGRKVITAMKNYLSSAENKGFPMPGQIRGMVSPAPTGDQLAIEASNKIIEAMGKFGYTNPEKAKNFMGPIAWEVIQREGGWANLCERTNNDDLPILKSQWREIAKVVVIRQKQAENRAAIGADEKLKLGAN